MVDFYIKYINGEYNTNPTKINEGLVRSFMYIRWYYKEKMYEFSREDNDERIFLIHVFQEYIIVCYPTEKKFNKSFPSPNNLVLYNLQKEVIQIIPPPKPISNWKRYSPNENLGGIKIIDGVKHIQVTIHGYDVPHKPSLEYIMEFRFLNLETFQYHPTEHWLLEYYGR